MSPVTSTSGPGPDQEIRGEAEVKIDASADVVYDLIADLARMGEWSPECYRTQLHEPADQPTAGATFQGFNRNGTTWWDVACKVLDAAPGQRFQFEAPTGSDAATVWTFTLGSNGASTVLVEDFVAPMLAMPDTPAGQIPNRRDAMIAGMATTLQRIKRVAEADQGPRR